MLTLVTLPSSPALMAVTTEFHTNSIFSFLAARSCKILLARSSLRRWMIRTRLANLVRKRPSSKALSPPPTTTTSLPRKKKPSQVAQ